MGCLTEAYGEWVHYSGIVVVRERLEYAYKKSLDANERNPVCAKQRRDDLFKHYIPTNAQKPECVVFMDETIITTNLAHLRSM